MADKKISQLPSLTDPIALDDLFVVVDQAPVCTTKNVTFQNFKDSLGLTNFVTTASFNAFTGSYQIDSASWNLTDNQLKASASAISASFALFDLDYQIDSASWNARLLAAEQCCATSSLSIAALNAHSASINNWTGSDTSVFAGTAATASYINVVSSNILVSWTGSTLNLTSNQAENQTLQAVTTAGNTTSGSIIVTGAGNIEAPSFTGSLLGTATSASYIKVTGSGVLVNWDGDLLQLTSSIDPNDYLKVSASYAQSSASLNENVNSLFVSASELTASLSLLSSSYLNFSASISDRAYKEELSSSRFEAASASVSAINIWTSSLSESVQAINAWSSSVLLSNLTSSFVLTSSYQIDSASWNNKYLSSSISASAIAYSASLLSASNAVINIWTSSLSQSVQAINAWSSSVMLDSEFLAWTLSPSASMAGTASNANLLEGKNSATFLTTGSGGANQLVNGGFTFVGGATISGSNFSGTSSWANNSTQAISASIANLALTASYINVSTLGLSNKWNGDVLELTSSLRSVNGIFPDAVTGNVAVALSETYTGTSSSFAAIGANTASYSEASIWVISGDPNPSQNGKTYIYNSGSVGQWFEVAPFDQASNDARYLKLDASNDPMQGELSMGGFKITSLLDGVLSTDAVNLGQLTTSVNTAVSYYTPTSSFNAFTGSYNSGSFTGSFTGRLVGTASHANNSDNALTASYIEVEGLDIVTKWFGSKLELTGSNVDGFLTTASFNGWTGSKFEPLSQSLLTASINLAAASASVQAINAVTQSFLTDVEYNLSSSIFISTGSASSIQQIDGSLTVNNLTGSLLGTAASASYFITSSVTSASLAQSALTASFVTGSNVYGPFGSNSVISASYAATASYSVNQIFLTGSSAISVLAKDANGYGQDGRVSIIGDGVSGSVTITTDINSEPNFCAAYLKYGGGNIVFAPGAGTTIFQTDNTLALSGKAGSSATLNRIGNEFYLRINNAS
jgi:hypothetical protein